MNKEMIVSSNDHETMVAILEDDQVVELFIERERNRGVVGNIYKGRVSKVLPGMQSAFVDLGLERDGFLYVTDVVSTTDQFDQLEASTAKRPSCRRRQPRRVRRADLAARRDRPATDEGTRRRRGCRGRDEGDHAAREPAGPTGARRRPDGAAVR